MKLSELRALVRGRIRDTVKPYLVTDQEIDDNLNVSIHAPRCRGAMRFAGNP